MVVYRGKISRQFWVLSGFLADPPLLVLRFLYDRGTIGVSVRKHCVGINQFAFMGFSFTFMGISVECDSNA